jgi:hypothetical protein
LTEAGSAGWRTLTQAVADGDLANGDTVAAIFTDTTVTNGPKLLEVGTYTWNNTTKVLTAVTIYQPAGAAQNWGAGTRDVLVVDNPLLFLLLTGGTLTGVLNVLINGSIASPGAHTTGLFQKSATSADEAWLCLVAHAQANCQLMMGSPANPLNGRLVYFNESHATLASIMQFYTANAARARITAAGVLQTAAAVPYDALPTGTKAVFAQAAAPTGWTQDTSQNDRVLRVVSGAGAGTGGSWTISGISVDSHTLTIAQMPTHDHLVDVVDDSMVTGAGAIKSRVMDSGGGLATKTTRETGGGGSHNHTLTIGSAWRPAYLDIIVCSKS